MKHTLDSQDWLPLLLYGLDLFLNPKPYKFLESFEEWNYRNCLRPQLHQLKRAKLLEFQGYGLHRTWSLTSRGRLAACGGIDPLQRWRRRWDNQWRFLIFDLPARPRQLRLKLWRWLRGQRFGLLQRSVWLIPDPIEDTILPLDRFKLKPDALTLIEGRAAAPASDAELVNSAWDFEEINARYQAVLEVAVRGLKLARQADAKPNEFGQWLGDERTAWLHALSADPLLPEGLLPSGYLGRQAWEQRQSAYAALAKCGLRDQQK